MPIKEFCAGSQSLLTHCKGSSKPFSQGESFRMLWGSIKLFVTELSSLKSSSIGLKTRLLLAF